LACSDCAPKLYRSGTDDADAAGEADTDGMEATGADTKKDGIRTGANRIAKRGT